ncbi:MAG: hypothetical protein ARM1_0480 [Candidatus Micrarchaeota archaeon]|nr:MAG: hypothetical protein ARM1_0480 [Candidatus Micrarchaeota archaeon]
MRYIAIGFTILALLRVAFSSTEVLGASASVYCPFNATLLNSYILEVSKDQIVIQLNSSNRCPIGPFNYTSYLYKNGSIIYSRYGKALANSSIYNISLNLPVKLEQGRYKIYSKINAINFSNYINTSLYVIEPPNISISVSYLKDIYQYSNDYIYLNLTNNGGLAARGIVANISISGPASISLSKSIAAIDPKSSYSLVYATQPLSVDGRYNIRVNVSYIYTFNNISYSSNLSISNLSIYVLSRPSVSRSSISSYTILPEVKRNISTNVFAIELPFYFSGYSSGYISAPLAIRNSGNSTIYARIITNASFNRSIIPDAYSIYIPEHQSIDDILNINYSAIESGLSIIPIYINISSLNGSNSRLFKYNILVQKNKPYGYISSYQYTLLYNNMSSAYSLIAIRSNANKVIRDAVIELRLPISVTDSSSNIYAYGLPSNISESNGSFIIR